MATRGTADIVFCLDSSASMQPCFDGVRAHLGDFIASLGNTPQTQRDIRFDYVAYCCTQDPVGFMPFQSVCSDNLLSNLYCDPPQQDHLFTTDIDRFRSSLARITPRGDEASLVGLDFALDFPWRPAPKCHRVAIVMTDEPFESGVFQQEQKAVLPALIKKIQTLRVILFLITPESSIYSQLAEVDRCEQIVVPGGDGLASVDFRDVLSYVGKSVSVSTLQTSAIGTAPRGLFRQAEWRAGGGGTLADG